MKTAFLTLSILLVSTVSGCTFFKPYKPTVTQGTVVSPEVLQALQPGLMTDQVIELLGPPLGKDPFNQNHWEYVFYTTDPEFQPDAVKHLVLNFDDEQYLIDWKQVKSTVNIKH